MFGNLCDVPGVLVGHATDPVALTGCTAVLFEDPEGATVGVDVRGSSPGTRETDRLGPHGTVRKTHALLLTGGAPSASQPPKGSSATWRRTASGST